MTEAGTTATGVPMLEEIERLMCKNHYCILATATRDGRPQSTGVIYCSRGFDLYIYADEHSAKARNIERNPNVAVVIPVWGRQLFWVPPQSIQFQGVANILPSDDRAAREVYKFRILFLHVDAAILKTKGCFLHVRPTKHINTYGVGVPRMTMARHPEEANRVTLVP